MLSFLTIFGHGMQYAIKKNLPKMSFGFNFRIQLCTDVLDSKYRPNYASSVPCWCKMLEMLEIDA
jgi:hypothetical protein